ncbi:MAG: O-antigen ligase family protein [bacterium]|nr:O-antigen ligase family protein [bacterium]
MHTLKSVKVAETITILLAFLMPIAYIPGYGTFTAFRYFLFASASLVLGLLTAWTWLRQRYIAKAFFKSWPSYGLLIYLAAFMLVSITSMDPVVSFFSSIERLDGAFTIFFLTIFAINCYTLVMVRGKKFIRSLLKASVFGAVILSISIMIFVKQAIYRGGGLMGNSSTAGAYMVWQVFFVAYLFLSAKAKNAKIWWALLALPILLSPLFVEWQVIFGIQLFNDVTSLIGSTRGAFLGLTFGAPIAFSFWLAFSPRAKIRRAGKIALLSVLALIVVLAVLLAIPSSTVHKEFGRVSTEARFIYWDIGIQGLQERPILGWGPGMFGVPYHKYFNPRMLAEGNPREVLVDQPHNIFIDSLSDGGIVLFLALLFFLATIVIALSRLKTSNRLAASLLLGAFTAWFIQAQFVFDLIVSYMILFLIAGVAYAKTANSEEGKKALVERNGKILMAALMLIALTMFIYTIYLPHKKARTISRVYNTALPARASAWPTLAGISPIGDQYDAELTFNRVYTGYINNVEKFRSADPQSKEVFLQEADNIIAYLDYLVQKRPYEYELILVNARMRYVRMLIVDDFSGEVFEKAVELAKRAVELSPTDPRAQVTLERIEQKLEFEEAIL